MNRFTFPLMRPNRVHRHRTVRFSGFNRLVPCLLWGLVLISGCMGPGMGMMGHDRVRQPAASQPAPDPVSRYLKSMTADLVADLSRQNLSLTTLAVLDFKSAPGLPDSEWIRGQVTAELLANGKYTVVTRERLGELLAEVGLEQSGLQAREHLLGPGKLVPVDAFLEGGLSLTPDKQLTLSLTLIETGTGVILWVQSAYRQL